MLRLLVVFGVGVYLGRYWHDVSINEGGVCVGGKDLSGKPCGPAVDTGAAAPSVPADPNAALPPSGDWYGKTAQRGLDPVGAIG